MENDFLDPDIQKPIFKKGHLQLATFFGGPLAIVYILAENYKQMGHPKKIKKIWIVGVLLCLLFFSSIFLIPASYRQQNIILPLICIFIGTAIMQSWQGTDISNHVNSGGAIYSMWRALLIGIISLAITFIFLVIVSVILKSFGLDPME